MLERRESDISLAFVELHVHLLICILFEVVRGYTNCVKFYEVQIELGKDKR